MRKQSKEMQQQQNHCAGSPTEQVQIRAARYRASEEKSFWKNFNKMSHWTKKNEKERMASTISKKKKDN